MSKTKGTIYTSHVRASISALRERNQGDAASQCLLDTIEQFTDIMDQFFDSPALKEVFHE